MKKAEEALRAKNPPCQVCMQNLRCMVHPLQRKIVQNVEKKTFQRKQEKFGFMTRKLVGAEVNVSYKDGGGIQVHKDRAGKNMETWKQGTDLEEFNIKYDNIQKFQDKYKQKLAGPGGAKKKKKNVHVGHRF